MSGFDDREKAQENKSAHDAELLFKATARRNRMLGEWVAEEFLGLTGDARTSFAKEVVAADFDRPGDSDVVEFVMGKVKAAGGDLSEARLRHKMNELLVVATAQISAES
ncbi:DUF1476 domain-containing protein [Thalassobaculum sp.]|jgi:hypothetical protein|uniref:DUF1476 domain-containing protein n=1 Tax=Thalassobaculum sp. TaxID=2022740 RepID=UPI003B5A0A33